MQERRYLGHGVCAQRSDVERKDRILLQRVEKGCRDVSLTQLGFAMQENARPMDGMRERE
jgi:hypothetical protein